jgi:hypothetical protein
MKLLDDIIDNLGDESSSLPGALLKTKILLHKIGHTDLVEWVNHELEGYGDAPLPDYRIARGQVQADLVSFTARWTNSSLPLMHLEQDLRDSFEKFRFNQSIATLQAHAASGQGRLEKRLPLEANGILGEKLADGVEIESARSVIGAASILQILVQVRSRLLDFALRLRDEIGDAPEAEVKKQADEADAGGLFRSAIFGDNATIIVGSHNNQAVNSHNTGGDLEGLLAVLRKAAVGEPEINSLAEAIKIDPTDIPSDALKRGKFGPAVSKWLGEQFSKAASSAWNVELGIAAGLLTTALQNYYG